ncbi:MAG: hypothetical protein ACD_76C00025G0007 [uncultured bacterium]|nr:MAG: hypothetical protein ACD_76C00025G0007 [uncultured bacterium]HBD05088.1 fructose-bisphosphate aldolase class I [Candidatus Uhrbacteria bacterium]
MAQNEIKKTIKALFANGKGLLAADESTPTITKRFAKAGLKSTNKTRRAYRNIFITAKGMEKYISGIILFDETIRQKADNGTGFVKILKQKGVVPGIKVDMGAEEISGFPAELATSGLDGLEKRIREYKKLGARFAKWRAVYSISKQTPSKKALAENSKRMAKYAKICQKHGILPIVEPEVIMDGTHNIMAGKTATIKALCALVGALGKERVQLDKVVFKCNMVLPGSGSKSKASASKVATETVSALKYSLPKNIGGVVFLSGGQSPAQAINNLKAISNQCKKYKCQWPITFSFARALQNEPLNIFAKKQNNIQKAQKAFIKRAKMCSRAIK